MIRLNLSPEPAWLNLGGGVRLRLAPLTWHCCVSLA